MIKLLEDLLTKQSTNRASTTLASIAFFSLVVGSLIPRLLDLASYANVVILAIYPNACESANIDGSGVAHIIVKGICAVQRSDDDSRYGAQARGSMGILVSWISRRVSPRRRHHDGVFITSNGD